eukprot:TRINITY_DN29366_c0_g1_i1.p4 TRINITY_DN29366_c0_g1~~TRINITY_DN29366_c0_g1_i1.p4  ORF type:complete len:127 (-),score=12.05 TRINITY_DN29366_c0_g1_i1:97-477(-)
MVAMNRLASWLQWMIWSPLVETVRIGDLRTAALFPSIPGGTRLSDIQHGTTVRTVGFAKPLRKRVISMSLSPRFAAKLWLMFQPFVRLLSLARLSGPQSLRAVHRAADSLFVDRFEDCYSVGWVLR